MKGFERKAAGVTLPELGLYAGVLALVGLYVVGQWDNLFSGVRVEQAFEEVVRVKGAAEAYRAAPAQGGSYTGVSVTVLANSGYNVEPLTDGDDENVYGLDVTVTDASSGADATLTYAFGEAADCEQVVDRLTGMAGVKGTPACGTGATAATLTVTLE